MFLIPILSSSCFILGIYIFGVFVLSPNQQQIEPIKQKYFHMGCFAVDNNMTHSSQLSKQLGQLKKKTFTAKQHKESFQSEDYLNSKGIQVAKAFQTYVIQYKKHKEDMINYYELSKAIRRAYQDYQNCTINNFTNHNIVPQNCYNIWIEYQNCSITLNSYKTQLNQLIDQKQQIQQKIKQLFDNRNTSSTMKNQKYKSIQNDNEKEYKLKDRQLQLQQKNIETHIKINHQRYINIKYNFENMKSQTLNSKQLYEECTQNRHLYRICQQLSKEVTNLGFGSLDGLNQKMKRKKQFIFRIQAMISLQKNKEQRDQLYTLHERNLNQYKNLHKVYIQMKAKITKNCGCTQRQQEKLFQILTNNIQKESLTRFQIENSLKRQNQYYNELKIIKQKRSNLSKQFQIRKKQNKFATLVIQQDILQVKNALKKNQTIVQRQILQYQLKFSKLKENCNKNYALLSELLQNISYINDCRTKQSYYQNLKSKMMNSKQKVKLKLQSKDKLIKYLTEFKI